MAAATVHLATMINLNRCGFIWDTGALTASAWFLFALCFCTCWAQWKSMRSIHLNSLNCMSKLLFSYFQLFGPTILRASDNLLSCHKSRATDTFSPIFVWLLLVFSMFKYPIISKKSNTNTMQLPYNFDEEKEEEKKRKNVNDWESKKKKCAEFFVVYGDVWLSSNRHSIEWNEGRKHTTIVSNNKKRSSAPKSRSHGSVFLSNCHGINLPNIWHSFCQAFGIELEFFELFFKRHLPRACVSH